MDYDIIKRLCEKKKVDIKLLAAKSNLTEAGLHKMIRNKSMKVENLEKIAEVLKVSMSVFFEDGEGQVLDNIESEIIRLQRELLTEKDKVIKLLEAMNNSGNCDK